MKYKILAAVLGLGALGYLLRNKIAEGLDAVLSKFDTMLPDPTEDEDTVFRGSATVPDLTDSFPVGKRHGEAEGL